MFVTIFLISRSFFSQAYFEDLAEREKAARLLNEPSPLVDYLNDELIMNHHNEDQKSSKNKKNKAATNNNNNKKEPKGTFNIDQFPSLPQPACSKNGSSIFDKEQQHQQAHWE